MRPTARSRPWCLPPVLLHEPGEALEGAAILREIGGPLGVLLWLSARDVALWAATPRESRAGLFCDGAGRRRLKELQVHIEDEEVHVLLIFFSMLVTDPSSAEEPSVAATCLDVAGWAARRDARATATAFAQAASLSIPADATLALSAGRYAAREQDGAIRAETWLRRTIGLARRSADHGSYTAALVELGQLYAADGKTEMARRAFGRATRGARRHGLRELRAAALHGLFRLASGAGGEDAARLARSALRAYGPAHAALPGLLIDFAAYWLGRHDHGKAWELLQRLAEEPLPEAARLQVAALETHAAAGLGDRTAFEAAWGRAWALIRRCGDGAVPDGVFDELGHAAAIEGTRGRMDSVALHAYLRDRALAAGGVSHGNPRGCP